MNTKRIFNGGLAYLLLLLILYLVFGISWLLYLALAVLLVLMISPKIFQPFSWLWYMFTELLGTLVSRILLSLIFYLVVTPVGMLRRLSGKDSLLLKQFNKGSENVFIQQNRSYTAQNLEKPY
jgi:hypothetical protein